MTTTSFTTVEASHEEPLEEPRADLLDPPTSWLGYGIAIWGIWGILALLGQALYRLTPLAIEPVAQGMMNGLHWACYLGWSLANAYMEGYRGFQLAFSPMVVRRAFELGRNPKPLHALLAPFYCMALFAAPKARMIVSWFIIVAVIGLILLIRQLSQPWRGIVDVGVVVGLGWGALSIVVFFALALLGKPVPRERRRKRR